jgi:pyruvate,water dikinase
MNQEALAASLSIAAQAAPEESLEIRHQQQQCQREETVQQALSTLAPPDSHVLARGFPVKKWIFNMLLRRAEKLFPHKENRNHSTYHSMMVIRQIAREIGSRMQARQLLPAAEDLFFLELEEIEMLLNKPGTASWLLKKINQRKASYLRSRQHIYQRAGGERSRWNVEHMEAIEVKGDPCSPGLAKGPARLVNGPGELQRVRPGEIVVCTQLRPAWSAVFSRAGGVVIEMGSLLSHGSALAREYGIPAVINVADITSLVRENDWLVVDGNQGRVAIERRGSTQQENQER